MNGKIAPLLTATGIAAICGATGIAAEPLEREAFVAGWPIELPADGTFFDIPLTYEIYQHGRSLSELAVLDQAGEPMPFYRVEVSSPVVEEQRVTLGVSPVFVRQEDGSASDITVATDGGRTDVTVTRGGEDAPELEVAAFVVDAREVEAIPIAMELQWRPLDRPFLMRVTIEHSEALTGWRNAGRGSVAALSIDGTSVTHTRISITGRAGGYYRIRWDRRMADLELERITLISTEQAETATYGSVDVPATEAPEEIALDNALYFDLGGALPVTSVDLVFPRNNSWASASIHRASSIEGPWRQITGRRLFYNIDFEDQQFTSLPIDAGRVESRYWRVLFDPELPADGAELRVEYPEERLRFSANGEPPYMLAGGTLLEDAGPDPTLAQVMSALEAGQVQAIDAVAGARVVLGGDAALVLPTEFPWRTVLLWLALIAAALTVGWMALRLAREMAARQERPGAD